MRPNITASFVVASLCHSILTTYKTFFKDSNIVNTKTSATRNGTIVEDLKNRVTEIVLNNSSSELVSFSQVKSILSKEFDNAIKAFEKGKKWRASSEDSVRSGLEQYLLAIKGTLGIRMQSELTREQALFMANCTSYHRDISLNF